MRQRRLGERLLEGGDLGFEDLFVRCGGSGLRLKGSNFRLEFARRVE